MFRFSHLFLVIAAWVSLGGVFNTSGQEKAGPLRQVDSTWQGVTMTVVDVKRIEGDRMIFLVRLKATSSAAGRTLIGHENPAPENTSPEDSTAYVPAPFSLVEAVMTDELSGKKFQVAPTRPEDIAYAPIDAMIYLARGKSLTLAVRFPIPPLPPPGPDGKIPKQTVSLQLPNAKGPITEIFVPAAN